MDMQTELQGDLLLVTRIVLIKNERKTKNDLLAQETAMEQFQNTVRHWQEAEIHFLFHRTPMKKKKHPKDMTTEEAMKHLFTHKGHKLIKKRREIEQKERVSNDTPADNDN